MEKYTDKYAPKSLQDFVFTDAKFQAEIEDMVSQRKLPNMLFYGPPGTGKTSLAKLLPAEVGAEKAAVKFFNGGLNGSIDDVTALSVKLESSAAGFTDFGKDIVIWDEVDLLSASALKSLKAVMDKFDQYASFIFTTNHLSKVAAQDQAFIDRCNCYQMQHHNKAQLLKFANAVLAAENKVVPANDVQAYVDATYPSIRKLLRNLEVA